MRVARVPVAVDMEDCYSNDPAALDKPVRSRQLIQKTAQVIPPASATKIAGLPWETREVTRTLQETVNRQRGRFFPNNLNASATGHNSSKTGMVMAERNRTPMCRLRFIFLLASALEASTNA